MEDRVVRIFVVHIADVLHHVRYCLPHNIVLRSGVQRGHEVEDVANRDEERRIVASCEGEQIVENSRNISWVIERIVTVVDVANNVIEHCLGVLDTVESVSSGIDDKVCATRSVVVDRLRGGVESSEHWVGVHVRVLNKEGDVIRSGNESRGLVDEEALLVGLNGGNSGIGESDDWISIVVDPVIHQTWKVDSTKSLKGQPQVRGSVSLVSKLANERTHCISEHRWSCSVQSLLNHPHDGSSLVVGDGLVECPCDGVLRVVNGVVEGMRIVERVDQKRRFVLCHLELLPYLSLRVKDLANKV